MKLAIRQSILSSLLSVADRREAIQKWAMVQQHTATMANCLQQRDTALARWDGEGGAGPGGPDWPQPGAAQASVATNFVD